MEIMRSKGKISVEFNNGELSALIVNVKVYANVGEYKGKGRLETPDSLYELEKALGEEIRKEITMAVEKTQKEYCSDIFGFGSCVRKYHPGTGKKQKGTGLPFQRNFLSSLTWMQKQSGLVL